MSKKKKILVIFIVAAILCLAAVIAVVVVKQVNEKVITVVPVENLAMDYYNDNQETVSGEITTQVTQKVQLDNDAVVSEVYVKKGDRVKTGDKLMSYDTTLTEMELEIEKLTKENNERKLKKAKDRLYSLEHGGPVEEGDGDSDMDNSYESDDPEDGDDPESASIRGIPGKTSGIAAMPVAAFRPVSLSNPSGESSEILEHTPVVIDPGASEETPTETPTDTPEPTQTPEPTEEPDLNTVYAILDFDSVPYRGSGTVEDPYCYLCDGEEEYIVVKGSFFNKMAGYNEDGSEKISEDAPYWYRIEFHENNRIADMENPEESLIGYYTRKGGSEPTNSEEEKHFSVDGAMMSSDDTAILTPTPTEAPDEDWDEDSDDFDDEGGEGLSREDAIKAQKSLIASLELQIKTNALQISKLEKKVKNQTVVATIDGKVTVVGDPVTGESDGESFLEVDSDEGLYVQGSIGELMLESVTAGQSVSVMAYESGLNFQAEIREISQFPSEDENSYYGMGNPNVSYYPFMAVVLGDAEPNNGEYVEITIETDADQSDALYIEAAFVRSENGINYVYVDDNGVLKKKTVKATKSFDGYTVSISSGLSREDKIAFPYGKGVEEGAKTKEGSMDDVYGYY